MRDRLIPLAGVAVVSLVCWAYLSLLFREMMAMPDAAMDIVPKPWSMIEAAAMLVMWWIMMIAMMLPSATMMLMTFATVNRRRRARGIPHVATAIFASGYLIAWGVFSIAATTAQWGLEQLALLSAMTLAVPTVTGGILLILAGLYQFTPLKHACLRHCRSPLDFVVNRWRDASGGALAMGVEHGLYCLGCCWVLMALLFVFGVMNLVWIAALTVLVLIEKAVPGGPVIARIGGGVMILTGGAMIAVLGQV